MIKDIFIPDQVSTIIDSKCSIREKKIIIKEFYKIYIEGFEHAQKVSRNIIKINSQNIVEKIGFFDNLIYKLRRKKC